MASMPIQNKQDMSAFSLYTHSWNEYFCEPLKFNLISCLAIEAHIKSPIIWKIIKSAFLSILTFKNDVWR